MKSKPKVILADTQALVDKMMKNNAKLVIVKPKKNASLWTSVGLVRKLTKEGMELVGRSKTKSGIAIDKLYPFAENDLEKECFEIFHATSPDLFKGFTNPIKALFYLRVIYIPSLCYRLLTDPKTIISPNLSHGGIAVHALAGERLLLERVYASGKNAKDHQGKSIFTVFNKVDYNYWLSRYDQWLEYTLRSWDHYIGKQSIAYRKNNGINKLAAYFGMLANKSCLPDKPEWISHLASRVIANNETRSIYNINKKKKYDLNRSGEFHSWLIECWPIVMRYDWNYKDVQKVAELREEYLREKGNALRKSLDNVSTIKDISARLGLEISNVAKRKVGRPKDEKMNELPVMYQVATWIWGLDDFNDWYIGMRGDAPK